MNTLTEAIKGRSGIEQAALLMLSEARIVHPLIAVWRHRLLTDPDYTGGLPHHEDVRPDEWAALGYTDKQIAEFPTVYAYEGRSASGEYRLSYRRDASIEDDEIAERIYEHTEDLDRAAIFLATVVELYRRDRDEGGLAQQLARYHEWVLRLTAMYFDDLRSMETARQQGT